MNSRSQRRERRAHGIGAFSLVEVVVALGIFAVGIAVVLRLFTGISDSIRRSGETEMGIHAAEALLGRLRLRSWEEVASCLMTAAELQRLDLGERSGSTTDPRLFFANATADRIGQGGDSLWIGHERERYFEIALVRDENLSPPAGDGLALVLAFTARVRWPAAVHAGAHRVVLSGSVFRRP